jgi:hypothetical protein
MIFLHVYVMFHYILHCVFNLLNQLIYTILHTVCLMLLYEL